MWLGSVRVRRFTGSGPWAGFPALRHRYVRCNQSAVGESRKRVLRSVLKPG